MNRVIVLTVVAILLVAGAVWVKRDTLFGDGTSSKSSTAKEVPRLPAIDKSLVRAFELSDGKETLRIARQGEGWVVPDAFDIPANDTQVKQLLDAITGLEKSAPVGSAPSMHSRFDLDEGGKAKRLKLEGDGGRVIVELLVGKPDTASGRSIGAAGTFVRLAGQNHVYLHPGRLAPTLNPLRRIWVDARLMPRDYQEINKLVETVSRLTIEYDDVNLGAVPSVGVPEIVRSGERRRVVLEARKVPVTKPEPAVGPEPAKPPEETPKDTERKWFFVEPESAVALETYGPMVDGVVRQVMGARFDEVKGKDPKDPAFGLDQPVLEATISFEDGTTRSLKVGALVPLPEGQTPQPGASTRFASASEFAWVVSLPEYLFNGLQKRPEDLKTPDPVAPGVDPAAPGAGPIALPEEGGGDPKKDEPGKAAPKKDEEKSAPKPAGGG